MKKFYLFLLFCSPLFITAQVSISTNGSTPDPSAMLDVRSNNKGMLAPRMNSAARNSISNPAEGLIIFNTDTKALQIFSPSRGWNDLEVVPPGKIFTSDTFPDPLYPPAEYDYLGRFLMAPSGYSPFYQNGGVEQGTWIQFSLDGRYRTKAIYLGSEFRKILFFGYQDDVSWQCDSCINYYDLQTGWTGVYPLGSVRRTYGFTATPDTTNHRIFFWGGYDSIDRYSPNPDLTFDLGCTYNYVTGVKTTINSANGSSPHRRLFPGAVWSPTTQKLYIFCGHSDYDGESNQTWAYTPTTDSWQPMANFPLADRTDPLYVYDGSDHILVWGGRNLENTIYHTDGAIYTISTNTWTPINLTGAPDGPCVNATWTGSGMLVSTASNSYYRGWFYDMNLNSWSMLPDIPLISGKPTFTARGIHFWNGENVYVSGKVNTLNVPILWEYSFASNSWTHYAGEAGQFVGEILLENMEKIVAYYRASDSKIIRFLPDNGTTFNYITTSKYFYYYKKK